MMNKVKYSNNKLFHTLGKVLLLFLFVLPAGKAVAQSCLTHSYSLNNTYTDALGGPSLVPAGGSLGASTYTFQANQGPSLSNAINLYTFSISMKFRVANVSGWRKLIDFNNLGDDFGLYILSGGLTFYALGSCDEDEYYNSTSIAANTDVCVVLTRNDDDKRVKGYVNGILQWSILDCYDEAIFSAANNIVQLFKDDFRTGQNEATAGELDDVKLYSCEIPIDVINGICLNAITPPSVTCPPAITRNTTPGQCGATVSFTGVNAATATGTPAPVITYSPASGSFFPVGTTSVTATATNTGGIGTCIFNVEVTDNEAPVLNPGHSCSELNQTLVNECLTPATDFNAIALESAVAALYHDNCGTVIVTLTNTTASTNNTDCNWSFTYTYQISDQYNNSVTCTVTRSGGDATPPTFTAPSDITIPFTSACGYDAFLANTGDVTDEDDNCATGLEATYDDVVSQCGNNIVITRTWSLEDNCGNAAANQVQIITVTDNNTDYIVYATKEAKFGESNIINGSVGVTAANGKAEFKKFDLLLSPHVARAKTVTVQMPANVNFVSGTPATLGPNPPFFDYAGGGLSGNYTHNSNLPVPAGDYKHLTIKKGVTTTVNGSNYGKVTIEEGATVSFTSGSIDMEELSVGKGKKGVSVTTVKFTNCTALRMKDRVTIEEDTRINVDGPKVNVYLGDAKKDEENFTIKGDNAEVTLNIMIPNGKLKIDKKSDDCIMTGWFIVEKLESTGSTTWNHYGCAPLLRGPLTTATESRNAPSVVVIPDAFKVNVFPNPSHTDFRLEVSSPSEEPVTVRIIDVSGRTLKQIPGVNANSIITIGSELRGGTYFAEVTQGANRKVLKLIKLTR